MPKAYGRLKPTDIQRFFILTPEYKNE